MIERLQTELRKVELHGISERKDDTPLDIGDEVSITLTGHIIAIGPAMVDYSDRIRIDAKVALEDGSILQGPLEGFAKRSSDA